MWAPVQIMWAGSSSRINDGGPGRVRSGEPAARLRRAATPKSATIRGQKCSHVSSEVTPEAAEALATAFINISWGKTAGAREFARARASYDVFIIPLHVLLIMLAHKLQVRRL